MNVLFVSQCNENALKESRRILDQFAERCGDRTWKTSITQQGLNTVRRLLKQTARRNTSVACHWIRGADHSDLLWIVGDISKFNEQGIVPTNTTQRDILRTSRENLWHTGEDIVLLAGIAGMFHDFGKANDLFQKKLSPNHQGQKTSEPCRHEWVSLRLFEAFVGNSASDQEWLEKMILGKEEEEQNINKLLLRDEPCKKENANPFRTMPPLARSIGWLILSHHRLPKWPGKSGDPDAPRLSEIDNWIETDLKPSWNSPQFNDKDWKQNEKKEVWKFSKGIPWKSRIWREKARNLAFRALRRPGFVKDWLSDPFSIHIARMVLMLSDHYYSAHEETPAWQTEHYHAYANTDKKTKKYKQKLDEHLVGVGHNAALIAKSLPSFRNSLPAITRHKDFKKRSTDPQFLWQNKAYELAYSLRNRAANQGFFGVNMASTGCGKTLANARIMYGLADEKLGCRFSVALGLRTLTLQTGEALRKKIRLEEEDLAVLIGSLAVRQLYESGKEDQSNEEEGLIGSESIDPLFEEFEYVRYEGTLADGRLSEWLSKNSKLHKLVSAPILVSTIDQLIPATEGGRGGRQIAPMLRLLTSDLILDEPDDFDLDDLPAVCRLSHWAGMLGSRILISSATLPPALIHALFEAYLSGRRIFQKVQGEPGRSLNVCCAWFDETSVQQSDHEELSSFEKEHRLFAEERASIVVQEKPLRQAELIRVHMQEESARTDGVIHGIVDVLYDSMHRLHNEHAQTHPNTGKRVSIGLIRMANTDPMIDVAKQLLSRPPHGNYHIHYCIYHSQYPIAIRSEIEKRLDTALTRHDAQAIWKQEEIRKVLEIHPEDNHLFVVLATSVAEVGRDHDYDWAIAEPSSMRSLIQLAGRVQRHRRQVPKSPNVLILSRNYKALTNKVPAFIRPGFESKEFGLSSHDLYDILDSEQFKTITSIPRIVPRHPLIHKKNLVDLEHEHLNHKLFKSKECAALWWRHSPYWSFELQRRTPFRKSAPQEEYALYFENEEDSPKFHRIIDAYGKKISDDKKFSCIPPTLGKGVSFWGNNDIVQIIKNLADSMGLTLSEASLRFGQVTLRKKESDGWSYDDNLGVYSKLD